MKFEYYRKLLGDGLELCPIDELQQVENQLERSLAKIRARKVNPTSQTYIYIYISVFTNIMNSNFKLVVSTLFFFFLSFGVSTVDVNYGQDQHLRTFIQYH